MHFFKATCFCTRCGSKHERRDTSGSLNIICTTCGERLLELEAMQIKGFVYVLVNCSIPDLFKIGMTERSPEDRAKEVSSGTGVPTPYEVLASSPSQSPTEDERAVHAALSHLRVGDDREFFSGDANLIVATIEQKTGLPAEVFGRFKQLLDARMLSRTTIWTQLSPSADSKRIKATTHGKNNFVCPECDRPMTPPNQRLKEYGVFRTCRECSFHVDDLGFEVVLMR